LAFLEDEARKRQSLTPGSLVGVHVLNEVLMRDPNLRTISGPSQQALPMPIDVNEAYLSNETRERITIDPPSRSRLDGVIQYFSGQNLINTIVCLAMLYYVLSFAIQWSKLSPTQEKRILVSLTVIRCCRGRLASSKTAPGCSEVTHLVDCIR
jgi:hypothetical protein